jgi:RNA polymerase sigma factor (sigma-70 family)
MPTAAPQGIRRIAARLTPETDGQLLARFLDHRDEAAFAELVRRHGPMVLGTCRRVAGNAADADDAFQATFVVLLRRARALADRACVGNFLYGVAFHTALKARAMAAKRRTKEARARPPEPQPDRSDVLAALDEEMARLPDKYREPVVLCELEGRSRREAAEALGVPQGTLSSRLAAAHRMLENRLHARGFAGAAVVAVLVEIASAVPDALADAAVRSAVAGPAAGVSQLVSGVTKMLFLKKLGLAAVALAALLALLALGTGASGVPRAAQPAPTAPTDSKPPPRGPNRILVDRAGYLTLIDPDGKNEQRLDAELAKSLAQDGRLSPDGKRVAFLVVPDPPGDAPGRHFLTNFRLSVRDVDGRGLGTDLGPAKAFAWSPDGAEIAASDFTATDGLPDVLKPAATHFVVNVRTGKKAALNLPDDHILTDWSRDGKYLVTTRLSGTKGAPSARVYLMNRDGTEHKAVTDGKAVAMGGKLSPDGRRVLHMQIELPKDRPPVPRKLVVADVATGATTPVEGIPLDAEVQSYCWSPDGRLVAYTWRRTINEGTIQEETEAYLVVCDPDGRNEKTVVTEKHAAKVGTLMHVDWR